MRAGLAYFRTFAEEARQNASYAEHRLAMPVLALSGSSGNGMVPPQQMRLAASNVEDGVIDDCGHWTPTEQPEELTRRLLAFFGTATSPAK